MAIKAAAERSRSPRYPSHSLQQAIEFVKRVYEGIHRSPVDSLTILKVMGFAGKSGASATALGSMRQYGLIQGFADSTRVSDLALSILEPISAGERIDAIKRAAESPAVFNQIFERFGGRLPNSNDALRSYLIRELGFSSRGARDCISAITGTQDFLNTLESDTDDIKVESVRSENRDLVRPGDESLFDAESVDSGMQSPSEKIVLRLTKDCKVEIRFVGTVSERALSALQKHLTLMAEVWAE